MKNNLVIDVPLVNKDEQDKKKFEKINDKAIWKMQLFLQVFSDETRIRILILLDYQEYTVTELCDKLSLTKSAVSHQLKLLRSARIVKVRKVGKNSFYSLSDEHVAKILETTIEHVKEE
jgi:ArsR family transcriptional regulator, lead/cadmium/zinc/bismuth-responsive transcriptional repressor